MKKKIAILGSTGSIGKCLLKIIEKDLKSFNVILLTANKNYRELFNQAKKFNVKNLIISDYESYCKAKTINKNNNFRIYNNFSKFSEIFKTKVDYSMSAIVGLPGLEPTINIIKYSKTIAIANKESIICGWNLILKKLNKHKTKFIPVDSEHFSVWFSINSTLSKVDKIYLTASGGPFYKRTFKSLKNVNSLDALKHPTWKMGKKITIDSATLINKLFEVIEAKKIFNVNYNQLNMIIHPLSYVHSIIKFQNGLISLIAHDTTMKIPILNSLNINLKNVYLKNNINLAKLNNLNFHEPKTKNFPLIKLLKIIPKKDSLFETALVTINDFIVDLFLKNKVKFTDISKIMLNMINTKKFKKYKYMYPRDIKIILKTKKEIEIYLNKIF